MQGLAGRDRDNGCVASRLFACRSYLGHLGDSSPSGHCSGSRPCTDSCTGGPFLAASTSFACSPCSFSCATASPDNSPRRCCYAPSSGSKCNGSLCQCSVSLGHSWKASSFQFLPWHQSHCSHSTNPTGHTVHYTAGFAGPCQVGAGCVVLYIAGIVPLLVMLGRMLSLACLPSGWLRRLCVRCVCVCMLWCLCVLFFLQQSFGGFLLPRLLPSNTPCCLHIPVNSSGSVFLLGITSPLGLQTLPPYFWYT